MTDHQDLKFVQVPIENPSGGKAQHLEDAVGGRLAVAGGKRERVSHNVRIETGRNDFPFASFFVGLLEVFRLPFRRER